MRRWLLPVVATVVLAGCSRPPAPEVATAQPPAGTRATERPAPEKSTVESDYDKALRYTRCLTDNGVRTPDPVVGEPLVTATVIDPKLDADVMLARMTAHEKCKRHLPRTWPVKVDPARMAKARPFFACMRSNGIDEPLPDENGMIQAETDRDWSTPEYQDALAKCRHLYDDPANDQQRNR